PFDFRDRDILTAPYNDILLASGNADIAIRIPPCESARVVPPVAQYKVDRLLQVADADGRPAGLENALFANRHQIVGAVDDADFGMGCRAAVASRGLFRRIVNLDRGDGENLGHAPDGDDRRIEIVDRTCHERGGD